ncbi:MAG: glycosyl transferase family 1, partial [Syntrophobacteraceae bacterium]
MSIPLAEYEVIVGSSTLAQLRRLGEKLAGLRVVHVSSTRKRGGVAEMLEWMVPHMRDVGVDASWEVVHGDPLFFDITKAINNGLQGESVDLSKADWKIYEAVNEMNAGRLRPLLEEADIVVIHNPQPAGLLNFCPNRKGRWIWRAHIDISRQFRAVGNVFRTFVENYDASVFSMAEFAQPLPHPQFLIPPSIDPLSEKNRDLDPAELSSIRA